MDKRRQSMLTLQLHQTLVSHMAALTRLSFLLHGQSIAPERLVKQLESDLQTEIARIGTEPTTYDSAELQVRVRIARSVVAGIRRDVLRPV